MDKTTKPRIGKPMELLIRVNHKRPVIDMLHVDASQRGDVIVIFPKGHAWSEAERSNPDWIIVHSRLTAKEVDALQERGREDEPGWRRRVGINVDGLATGAVLTHDELIGRFF